LAWLDASDCVDAVEATAAPSLKRAAAVVVEPLPATGAAVTTAVVVAAAACVAVEVFAVAAKHPVSAHILATLHAPATLRARRAGCGRVRRDPVAVILPPSVGVRRQASAWPLNTTLDSMKNRTRSLRPGRTVLEPFLTNSQARRICGSDNGAMADARPPLR